MFNIFRRRSPPHGAWVSRLQYGTQVSRLRNIVSITLTGYAGISSAPPSSTSARLRHSSLVTCHFHHDLTLQKYKETRCDILNNLQINCLKSCDDVGDDENAKEPLVKVSGNPFFPMGYRENINLRTFTGL